MLVFLREKALVHLAHTCDPHACAVQKGEF